MPKVRIFELDKMIEKIKMISKNKEMKVLMENFISLFSLQIIGMCLPLITLPYVLRVLELSNYGIIVLASSLINYFIAITDYSFKITATRDVAVFKNSPQKLNLIYSKVLIVKGILLLISIVVISLIVLLYEPFYKERLIFFLTMPMLFGYVIFPEWFFQGIEKMKYITFLNLGIKVFFTLGVFLFITKKEDYWVYPLLQSLGFIVSGIIAQFILVKKYKLKFFMLKRQMIKQAFIVNYPVFTNQFLPTLYNNTSTFMLGIMSNSLTLGLYDAIKRIIDLGVMFINILSRVFFPYLNRNKNAFESYKKLMLISGLTLTLLPIIFSKLIFFYLNIKSEDSFEILVILCLGIFFVSLYDIFGVNYFIIKREDKIVMRNTVFASLLGFVLSFPLISYFGIIGASVNLTFTRGLMGGGLLYKYIGHKNKIK